MFKTMAGYPTTDRPTRPAGQKTAGLLSLLGALLLSGLALDANSALGGSHDSTGDLTRRFLAQHAQWQRGDDRVRSEGMQALVSMAAARQQQLAELIADPLRAPQAVFAIGPVPMMRAVAELTRPHGIETVVSLNPIMIDGTGMCGGCRVVVGGESRFACVDGPEFDGHLVDFDNLSARLATYRGIEAEHICRLAAKEAA